MPPRNLASVATVLLTVSSLFAQSTPVEDTPTKLEATAKQMTIAEVASLARQASGGEAKAQLLLGIAIQRIADGLHWDPSERRNLYASAASWYQKAAAQGSVPAQYFHAVLISPGSAFRVDCQQALDLLDKAIEQKYAAAMTFKGWLHEGGPCVEKSYEAAIGWFKRGAEGGDATAFYQLARLYEEGRGVGEDQQEATKLYLQGAELGHAGAQNQVGIRLAEGIGTTRDDNKAVEWFLRAAKQGDSYAQCNVALHYANGKGFPKDEVAALMWAIISATIGAHCYPEDFLDVQRLTESQVSEARQRAEAWLSDHRFLSKY